MRRTLRLLANVRPARYLEAGNPTGLTGVYTHSSPRSSLLYLYSSALEKLQQFPESSVYRQSVEALTKHRMAIVEAAEPPGYAEWAARARQVLAENGGATGSGFETVSPNAADGARAEPRAASGRLFVRRNDPEARDVREEEWDGEKDLGPGAQGLRGQEDRESLPGFASESPEPPKKVQWEAEPQMTADQVEEVENKIGAGLIEEVVKVAESELKLIDIMYKSKAWEDLEEKPPAGQWTYFER